jgi:uncharacterized protein YfaS (alpha-2-macroglobulin family)
MVSNHRRQAVDSWEYEYNEMRRDRVLFSRDSFEGKGKFRVEYLARVVAACAVVAPPSRIEMMYAPPASATPSPSAFSRRRQRMKRWR